MAAWKRRNARFEIRPRRGSDRPRLLSRLYGAAGRFAIAARQHEAAAAVKGLSSTADSNRPNFQFPLIEAANFVFGKVMAIC